MQIILIVYTMKFKILDGKKLEIINYIFTFCHLLVKI